MGEEFMSIDAILNAYRSGHFQWRGCQWHEEFGPLRLDLNGLTARQARILANATAGTESRAWHQAADWLEAVERDAKTAEAEASLAVHLATSGRYSEAECHATSACILQKKYPADPVWNELLDCIRNERREQSVGC